jgi:glyoxylase-like metal-dependent hydrolase (beta-lactamase superfamily II)
VTATVGLDWDARRSVGEGVTLIWETRIKPFYRCNIWHVRGRDGDLLIDSGMGLQPLAPIIAAISEKPVLAVASHGHVDHIGGHHEFAERAVHVAEAVTLAAPDRRNTIAEPYLADDMFEGGAFDGAPIAGFECATYCVKAAPATRFLRAGDVIDLGDRAFEVLHLPGHSPGSIALWDPAAGLLFSGDVVYDGPLIDDFHHSAIDDYVASMEWLRRLPVTTVHAGHFASFDRHRLATLIDGYIAGKAHRGVGRP